jgi:hypothetical protein
VVLLGVLRLEGEPRRTLARAARGSGRLAGRRREEALRELDDLGVVEVAGRGHDEVRRRVAGPMVRGDLGDRYRLDHSGIAQHPASQGVGAVDRLGEHVVDSILGLVLVHRDLLQHHVALGVDLVSGQRRAGEHLGEEPECLLRVLVEEAGVQVRGLLAGRRVRGGAHAIEQLRDLDRGVALRALEKQVLEEVRDARLLGALVARARPHPEPQRHRAHRGHRLADHPRPVPQRSETNALG